MRPAVLLMAARLAGYQGDRAVLYAAVVEFIHTATLVHDDIIDDSDLRRGRLAVHSRWGNDITVLLGDYLYIKSMAMALTHDTLDLVRLLCDVTLRMIEGELYQLTKNGDADITEDEHFDIIRRKTAYLFGGCAQIGGMLGDVTHGAGAGAPASTASTSALRSSSWTTCWTSRATPSRWGSRSARDLREGKVTLPLIHLLQQDEGHRRAASCARSSTCGRPRKSSGSELLADPSRAPRRSTTPTSAPSSTPSAPRSRCYAFPPSAERDALLALPDYVLSRDR